MAKKLNALQVQRLIDLFDDEEAGEVSLDESVDSLEIHQNTSDEEEEEEEPLPESILIPSNLSSSILGKNNNKIPQSMSIYSINSNKNSNIPQSASSMSITTINNNNIPQSASSMSITSINNSNIPQSTSALSSLSKNKYNNTQSCTNNFLATNLNENLVIPSPIPTNKFFKTPLKIDSKSPAKLSIISKKLTTTSKFKKNTNKAKTSACKKIESKIKSDEIKLAGPIKSSHNSLVNYFLFLLGVFRINILPSYYRQFKLCYPHF